MNSKTFNQKKSNKDFLLEKFSESIPSTKPSFRIDELDDKISLYMHKIVLDIINSQALFEKSQNDNEKINSIRKFLNKEKLGKNELIKKTGKNILKIQDIQGINQIQFVKKFFEIIFRDYLENYQYDVIEYKNSVTVIFR